MYIRLEKPNYRFGDDMMNSIERKIIADGVAFNNIKVNRFKTIRMSVNLYVPLNVEDAAHNALLRGLLTRSCKAYPDFTQFSKKLSALYGTDIVSSVKKTGAYQVLTFTAVGIDDRYVFTDEIISAEISKLLCEVIFNPNITDGKFNDNDFEQERRQLLDAIDAEFNDKRGYAISTMLSNMLKNETCGIKRYGSVEEIKKITPESLVVAWKKLLKDSVVEIFYIGDSGADKAEKVFTDAYSKIDRTPCKVDMSYVKSANEVQRVVEEMDVSQSKLVLGFRSGVGCTDTEKEWIAGRLMCAVLGGTANSKLFNNVREKQSLCYYCAASYNFINGLMIVDSGVLNENIEKTEKAILKEVEDMKNGNITDFEIEATKRAIVNGFRTSNDTTAGIDNWYSSQFINDGFNSIEELAAKYNAVTKEEIVEAAKKLTLDTVYVLKNK